MKKFKALLKVYVDNIFNGKLETLAGALLFGVVITNYVKDGVLDSNDYLMLVGGLALLGVNFGAKPQKEERKEENLN